MSTFQARTSSVQNTKILSLLFALPIERSQCWGPEEPFGPEQLPQPGGAEQTLTLPMAMLQRWVSLGRGCLVSVSSRAKRALLELSALGLELRWTSRCWQHLVPVPAVTAQPCCAQSHFPKCLIILQLKNKKPWLLLLIQLPERRRCVLVAASMKLEPSYVQQGADNRCLAFKYPGLRLPRIRRLLSPPVAIFAVHTCLRSSSVSFAAHTDFTQMEAVVALGREFQKLL